MMFLFIATIFIECDNIPEYFSTIGVDGFSESNSSKPLCDFR
jgi:hypothetical protein